LSGVYEAWRRARQDIFDEWMRATDPANLQPKIRPLFREIADHLRLNPPEGVTQESLEDALNSIEAPWGIRIERGLRAVFAQELPPRERSANVIEKVRELGLTPYRAPQPLDVIDLEEVNVVCWMAVQQGNKTVIVTRPRAPQD
jgi:hypothetical protein